MSFAKFFHYGNKLLSVKFFRFGIVGGLGSITNLLIFFILVDTLKLYPIPISILCFMVADTHNYLLNHIWTFQEVTQADSPSINGFIKYLLSSLIGLSVNIITLWLLLQFFHFDYKSIAQAIGILSGMLFNFVLSKYFVFVRNKEE